MRDHPVNTLEYKDRYISVSIAWLHIIILSPASNWFVMPFSNIKYYEIAYSEISPPRDFCCYPIGKENVLGTPCWLWKIKLVTQHFNWITPIIIHKFQKLLFHIWHTSRLSLILKVADTSYWNTSEFCMWYLFVCTTVLLVSQICKK